MGTPKGTKPWNAGTSQGWTDKRGYRWLYVEANGKRRARREHRVIMERHLGRRLEPWELVHHKDGDPRNNTIENLELTEFGAHTAEHHTGARRNADARRSMEAFALLREELRTERAVKAELLEALAISEHLHTHGYTQASIAQLGEEAIGIYAVGGSSAVSVWARDKRRAAIAKAESAAKATTPIPDGAE